MPEKVRRAETGATALRLGGVGAITARELLRCGLDDVTLLAPVSPDAPGRTAQQLFRQQPYAVIAAPARATVGYTPRPDHRRRTPGTGRRVPHHHLG